MALYSVRLANNPAILTAWCYEIHVAVQTPSSLFCSLRLIVLIVVLYQRSHRRLHPSRPPHLPRAVHPYSCSLPPLPSAKYTDQLLISSFYSYRNESIRLNCLSPALLTTKSVSVTQLQH